MAKGVNEMVCGHIAVKKKAMACIAEFGKGNFEAPLEQFPGKKAFINEQHRTASLQCEEVHWRHDPYCRKRTTAGDIDAMIRAERKFEGDLSHHGQRGKRHGLRPHRGQEEGHGLYRRM